MSDAFEKCDACVTPRLCADDPACPPPYKYNETKKAETAMTQAQHTPGPWRFTGFVQTSNFGGNIAAVQADGTVLARVKGGVTENRETAAANARLIAAAPDLLEALKSLQAIMCDPEDNPCFAGSDGDHAVAREAFAAIAKAEARP